MPRQENFAAALEVSVLESPPSVIETADHVVEFDLDCSGRIALEGSGGSGLTEIAVPPGRYRARLSGFGLDAASAWTTAIRPTPQTVTASSSGPRATCHRPRS
ncbi:MAG TPA: hypothetical protein VJ838_06690 [Gaiellaceae bacterium]|nr:hypothetical protein [Gaiellaceae bacterium]